MASTDVAITHYQAHWHVNSNTGNIVLVFQNGQHMLTGLAAPSFHAVVDILRNERPVYWNPVDEVIHTLSELVGEGEMK